MRVYVERRLKQRQGGVGQSKEVPLKRVDLLHLAVDQTEVALNARLGTKANRLERAPLDRPLGIERERRAERGFVDAAEWKTVTEVTSLFEEFVLERPEMEFLFVVGDVKDRIEIRLGGHERVDVKACDQKQDPFSERENED